jgi:hypothetical protein
MLPDAPSSGLFQFQDEDKSKDTSSILKSIPEAIVKRNTWFQELSSNTGLGSSIKTVKRLVQTESDFQKIEVYQTE